MTERSATDTTGDDASAASDIGPYLRASIELDQKKNFYLIALAFTVLGFAVPSLPAATFTAVVVAEILSWMALLFSGILGLRSLEDRSTYLRYEALLEEVRRNNPETNLRLLVVGDKSSKHEPSPFERDVESVVNRGCQDFCV
ncbi:MAG: hypothetical protein R3F22_11695 [Lysobacteraceae bacterium]